ncbi:MAG: hypothetical protein K8F92_00780 [Hyphomicrobium sp.]|uniref:hypothetical protein n=1 Tax=Hyphomicrobium sp. TaxID=82 RepID=UPI00132B4C67|nr:hypothetical protein [Hyphomicrobium sp.]KAB2939777.1 MAG: hypothetical protein F9K20_15900 [Hyphomicrobium sp.]MBZ0208178.1 hypothetical protein [Hyphomicrobium sp.]
MAVRLCRWEGIAVVTLAEAVAAERSKRRQDREDASKRKQVGRALLQALQQRLDAEPLPAWSFALDDDRIHVCRNKNGSPRRVGTWTVDHELRLVLGQEMTEWITAESCNRVIDEAVQITARFIIDAEERQNVPQSRLAAAAERWRTFFRAFGAPPKLVGGDGKSGR